MLGSAPLEAVLGAGIDNTDHTAVRAFIRQAADLGLNILFIYPNSKVPADMRTPAKRRSDDKAAQEAAQQGGRRDWATVKSPAGLALATDDKATLDRYLKAYIQQFSKWEYTDDGASPEGNGTAATWAKKLEDTGAIVMTEPVGVNLAVEVGGSGVVVVDCDTEAQVDRWFEVAEIPEDARPAPTVLTPGQMADGDPNDPSTWAHSDGGHFWFTVPDRYMPVLPRHLGAMTWGGDNGFAVLWDRRYVLIPPSTRPEGAYEQLGHVYELPDWLAEAIIKQGQHRVQRAEGHRTDNTELATAVDKWAESVSWASILEPLGWTPAPRADSCGCAVWTAPGIHASPKSATAHDTGCTAGRYTETNAPLHLWTDHDAAPFTDHMDEPGWTPTFSKLQAVALVSFGGKVGAAMDALEVTPDLSVEPGLDAKGVDRDLDTSGDGDFSMPTAEDYANMDAAREEYGDQAGEPETDPPFDQAKCDCTVNSQTGQIVDYDCGQRVCVSCRTHDGLFVVDPDDGLLWHAADADDAAETGGHRADGVATDPRTSTPLPDAQIGEAETYADDLPTPLPTDPADLPADFGTARPKADTPYRDDVSDPDPDVFDSPHNGVPRIAPFSHWRDMPPPEFIIDGLLEHGGLTSIIGTPGAGKSTVALDMACHIATGKRWQGRVTFKTPVLYLPGEGLSGAVQRIRAWEDAHQMDLGDDLLLGNGIILVNAMNEAWGEIAAYIARKGIGLVIFDTFARMSAGLEENSATDVGKAVRRFDKLKELTNAGVCVVHHTGKADPNTGRGSSALNGALDSELLVRHGNWDTTQVTGADGRLPGKPIELVTTKQKNAEQLEHPIPLLMISHDLGEGVTAPLITSPNGTVDPMEGEPVLARPLPEPVVETAIRIRDYVDRLTQQGATRAEIMTAVLPDGYARSRNDTAAYWKQRIAEAVDRGLRYSLIETLTGTASGSRYIPSTNTRDQARAAAAAEINDAD
ncbi:DNA primase/helicase [Mycobacterium phage KayaCho]|uniref:DNA polymerase/primase n=1 Tax=Mycobacterium phage KayaCho TaxID=1340830 RepID=UPI0003880E0D|nr:DNA polymerase/primase [Mycobacterium phage KayaCho]AGT12952.1 DNA primase/helicase [Mycobacterium phage KayaCho]